MTARLSRLVCILAGHAWHHAWTVVPGDWLDVCVRCGARRWGPR